MTDTTDDPFKNPEHLANTADVMGRVCKDWQSSTARYHFACRDTLRDLANHNRDLMAQLADAKAAQAMVVERAVEAARQHRSKVQINEPLWHDGQDWASDRIAEAIEALADPSGVEALAALRAERDERSSPNPYDDTAHFDDHAVNRFAVAMKGKLAAKRLQGRGGWQEPEVLNGYLSRLLREHVDKGDPVDVANFAMMIHQRGERIAPENEGASCKAIDKAEAERDALAARLAAAEGQVAALTEALEKIIKQDDAGDMMYREDGPLAKIARAALAEVQADARREGGE